MADVLIPPYRDLCIPNRNACVETKALMATWYSKPGHRERVGGTPNVERATSNERTVRRSLCLAVSSRLHSSFQFIVNLYPGDVFDRRVWLGTSNLKHQNVFIQSRLE